MDYYAQHMHNCDLVNLEDMLQNGTVISGTMIEKLIGEVLPAIALENTLIVFYRRFIHDDGISKEIK